MPSCLQVQQGARHPRAGRQVRGHRQRQQHLHRRDGALQGGRPHAGVEVQQVQREGNQVRGSGQ